MKFFWAWLLWVSTSLALQDGACPHHPDLTCHDVLPSLIYTNGLIYTVDAKDDPRWVWNPKSAVVIEDGIIKFVGSNKDALKWEKPESRVVDLEGQTVIPGIHDTHLHPVEAQNYAAWTCNIGEYWPIDGPKMHAEFESCKSKQIGTEWILGWGHSIEGIMLHLANGGRDPKEILDAIMVNSEGRPVPAAMMEMTSHSMWVNSEALRRAGIDASTPNPVAGIIMKNAQGDPNGILLENAGNNIMDQALNVTLYPELKPILQDGLRQIVKEFAENGITSVVDARAFWGAQVFDEIWDEIEQEGTLTTRAVLAMWVYPELEDDYQIPALKAKYRNNPRDLVKRTQIKVYLDGILDSTTAAILSEYQIDYDFTTPENNGMNYIDQARAEKYLRELQSIDGEAGFDFLIHAIGNRGVREGLNAIENTMDDQSVPARHRIAHVELVDPDDLPRFVDLNTMADIQVSGWWTMPEIGPDPFPFVSSYVGKRLAEDFIPMGSLYDFGTQITLSSDYDVAFLNPFIGLSHATSRGRQSVFIEDAVTMYTLNGAFAMRQEDQTGSITVGKEADIVVLDRDIFAIPSAQVRKSKVRQTLLRGRQIYNK